MLLQRLKTNIKGSNIVVSLWTYDQLQKISVFDHTAIDHLLHAVNLFRGIIKKKLEEVYMKHEIKMYQISIMNDLVRKAVDDLIEFFKESKLVK